VPAVTASTSTLREEFALIETARRQLAAGDAAGSLSTIDRYDQSFKGGVLADEAAVTRIEALFATAGQGERAAALARRYLEDHPTSPHAERVRSLLQGASP
jgi:hypothetical protein